jgi:hypothetical protein
MIAYHGTDCLTDTVHEEVEDDMKPLDQTATRYCTAVLIMLVSEKCKY